MAFEDKGEAPEGFSCQPVRLLILFELANLAAGDRAGGPHAGDRPMAAAPDRAGGPHAPALCPFSAKGEARFSKGGSSFHLQHGEGGGTVSTWAKIRSPEEVRRYLVRDLVEPVSSLDLGLPEQQEKRQRRQEYLEGQKAKARVKGQERREARAAGLGLVVGRGVPSQDARQPSQVVPDPENQPDAYRVADPDQRRRDRWHRRRIAMRLEQPVPRYAKKIRGQPREALLDEDGKPVMGRSIRASCGYPSEIEAKVTLERRDNKLFYRGLLSCKSVWACPVCTAKIRAARGIELEQAIDNHRRKYPDGSVVMVTATIRHSVTDPLDKTLAAVQDAWGRGVCGGKGWVQARQRYGILGQVRATEIRAAGRHGWSPHLHNLLSLDRQPDDAQLEQLRGLIHRRWSACLVKNHGLPEPSLQRGVHVQRMTSGAGGAYLVKEGGGHGVAVAMEMTRFDLKESRTGASITPFELLDRFEAAEKRGDTANAALAEGLWIEYVEATKGRKAMHWSQGLKELLEVKEQDPDDQPDGEMADDSDGESLPDGRVMTFTREQWRALNLVDGGAGPAVVLDLVENGLYVSAERYVGLAVNLVRRRDELRSVK